MCSVWRMLACMAARTAMTRACWRRLKGRVRALTRRGPKGVDDRRFLEAVLVDASDGRSLERSARRAWKVEHCLSPVSSLGSCRPVGSVAADTRRAAAAELLADR